ncbi:hypothetical protein [Ammonifex degensii]|uniref:hypothetical protein n=1 Tax=Ammonifex degensii TaxID=42838 RepID=UPI00145DFE99|nr:hypothetical protein [Ammonifex degensii]
MVQVGFFALLTKKLFGVIIMTKMIILIGNRVAGNLRKGGGYLMGMPFSNSAPDAKKRYFSSPSWKRKSAHVAGSLSSSS